MVTVPTWAGKSSKIQRLKTASQRLNPQKYLLLLPHFRLGLWPEQCHS